MGDGSPVEDRAPCSAFLNGWGAAPGHLLQEAVWTNSLEGPGRGLWQERSLDAGAGGGEVERKVQITLFSSLTLSAPLSGERASP